MIQFDRRKLFASTVICGAAMTMLASPAMAAAAAAPADATAEVTEVVVTGSRIPQPNLTSVSPIQVVTGQEIKLQGQTDAIDLLNQLPQNFQNSQADFSSTSNPLTSPGGTSTADLRGLGPQRTLVLVNGRRLGIGDPNTGNTNPAPDLNQIPLALVDHVEVLTGGASATYGSDAVAGVVNFVMKHDFSGIQIDGQYGFDEHGNHHDATQAALSRAGIPGPKDTVWDGHRQDLSFILGGNFDDGKGNVTAYLTYHKQDPVRDSSRDWGGCLLGQLHPGVLDCAGSGNSNKFTEIGGGTYTVIGNQFVPFATAPKTGNPPLAFNSNPFQYLLHGDTRYSGGFFAHYDLSQYLTVYSDFSLMSDSTITEVAPAGLFGGTGSSPNSGFLINCNNPLLSAQQAATICTPAQIASGANQDFVIGRRNVEGGPRHFEYDHDNYRAVLGARGDIPSLDGFKYDVFGSYYYTNLYQANDKFVSVRRVTNALQVVNVNGTPTCISVVNKSDTACVPYNIFQQGGVTKAALDYITADSIEHGKITETIAQANVTGELGRYGVQSPWAHDGVGVALGFENRRQTYEFKPDEAATSNDLSGFGGAAVAVNASLGVTEEYAELRVPIVQDMALVKDLVFEGGYRHSRYSTDISANTYKVGLQWAPTDDIRFRASFNRAIRAPNIVELYSPVAVTNSTSLKSDPCAPTVSNGVIVPASATFAQCARTGVTQAQYGNGGTTNTILQCPAGQCAVLIGGNADLQPERASTYTVGFTATPSFLPGFVGSIDYYNIKIEGLISSIPLQTSLNECLANGSPIFCANVVRSPSGFLFGSSVAGGGFVSGTAVNVAQSVNSGVDIQAAYRLPLTAFGLPDVGSLSFNLVGSALIKSRFQSLPTSPAYDCAGLFGPVCQTLNPKWRHQFRVTWDTPWDLLFSAQWRYIGGMKLDTNSTQPGLSDGFDALDAHLPPTGYLDLSASWNVRKNLVLRAGINNVLDTDPKILDGANVVGAGLPNAYPTYDYLGRQVFASFTARF